MISAIDNNKNQYYERVGAVNLQTQRGYPPEFLQDLQKKTDTRVDKTFGSLTIRKLVVYPLLLRRKQIRS